MAEQRAQQQNQQQEMSVEQATQLLYRASRKVPQPVDGVNEPAQGHEICRGAGDLIIREVQRLRARVEELEKGQESEDNSNKKDQSEQ